MAIRRYVTRIFDIDTGDKLADFTYRGEYYIGERLALADTHFKIRKFHRILVDATENDFEVDLTEVFVEKENVNVK